MMVEVNVPKKLVILLDIGMTLLITSIFLPYLSDGYRQMTNIGNVQLPFTGVSRFLTFKGFEIDIVNNILNTPYGDVDYEPPD